MVVNDHEPLLPEPAVCKVCADFFKEGEHAVPVRFVERVSANTRTMRVARSGYVHLKCLRRTP
jgi:hypothetical protein